MPKASLASKDAVEVSLGIQEGVIEITGAVVKVHQYPPNRTTGEQGEPFPCVQITAIRCDKDGQRISDEEIKEELGIGKIERFHPGKADSATDDEPEDLGAEVDTEGNCIYAVDGSKLNKRSKWIMFGTSLEEKGFKPEVLGNGYMPDLIGMKLEVKTETLPRTPGYTAKKDPTALVAVRILVFPYDKRKAGKATAPAVTKPKTNGAATATAAPAATASASGSGADETVALTMLTQVADEYAGQDGIERRKLQTAVQTRMMRGKVPVKQHKPVLDLVKDDTWLTTVTMENADSPIYGRISVDFDAQTVMFAAKE